MKKKPVLSCMAVAMVFVIAGLVACSSSDNPASRSSTGGVFTSRSVEDGLTLMADPETITIDTTDPATPTDPNNGNKHFGETTLIATATEPETSIPQPGIEITFSSNGGVVASGGSPVITDANGVATDTLRLFEDDTETVEASATDGTRVETVTVTNTVILPNEPPVADAGGDISVECEANGGSTVTLDGSNSSDPDSTAGTSDDIVLYEWFEDFGTATEILLGEGAMIDVIFPAGSHDVTLRVTDSRGETSTDVIVVDVVDATPPVVDLGLSPSELWPPNHRMWNVEATLDVTDCSPVSVVLVSVESNEPDNGIGDGNHEPDVSGVEAGTEDYQFMVRAERAGPGSGRVYTVTYTVTDDSGNATTATGFITVPHDRGL